MFQKGGTMKFSRIIGNIVRVLILPAVASVALYITALTTTLSTASCSFIESIFGTSSSYGSVGPISGELKFDSGTYSTFEYTGATNGNGEFKAAAFFNASVIGTNAGTPITAIEFWYEAGSMNVTNNSNIIIYLYSNYNNSISSNTAFVCQVAAPMTNQWWSVAAISGTAAIPANGFWLVLDITPASPGQEGLGIDNGTINTNDNWIDVVSTSNLNFWTNLGSLTGATNGNWMMRVVYTPSS
jgi:hypothetical protein